MFGPKQNYSSKHLDRTSTGPGLEQLRCLNSLLDAWEDVNELVQISLLTLQLLQFTVKINQD